MRRKDSGGVFIPSFFVYQHRVVSNRRNQRFRGKAAQDAAAREAYGTDMATLEECAALWQKAYNAAEKQAGNAKTAAREGDGVKYSLKSIVGPSGKEYGVGVYLDSPLLENLTNAERIQMVKERIRELGGQSFIAYDPNGKVVNVRVAEPKETFINRNGKRVPVNRDLVTKNRNTGIKQDAVVLIDEMIATASFDNSRPSAYSHGWLDNHGRNNWQYWDTYIQDKENAVWKATLNIATSQDGTHVLYDVDPIRMVERPVKSGTTSTKNSISTSGEKVNEKFQLKSATELAREVRELKKERRALENRNKVLTERVAKWRGELRRTETPSVRPDDVKKLERRVLDEYGSSTAYRDIEGDMTALGKALMAEDVSMDTLRPHARAAAEKIIDGVLAQAESCGELLASVYCRTKSVTPPASLIV